MSNILKKQGADVKKQLIQKEMDESIKNSQLRLKKAFRSTAYALKSNDQQSKAQTHEDEFGEEYELDISEIADLPNVEHKRRYQVPESKVAKMMRKTQKDHLVELQTLVSHDDTIYNSVDGFTYPGISTQILTDLSSVTRKVSSLELREGNSISRKSELLRVNTQLGQKEDPISQLAGLVSWNQLIKNGAVSDRKLHTVPKELRGYLTESSVESSEIDESFAVTEH